jgi:hypothetical protein
LIDNSVVDSTIMTTSILTKVVPNICQQLPDSTCLVLGKAIVWFVFSSFANNFVSLFYDYCNRVKANLAETGIVIELGKNPILKMPVLVSGDQGTVYISCLLHAVAFSNQFYIHCCDGIREFLVKRILITKPNLVEKLTEK